MVPMTNTDPSIVDRVRNEPVLVTALVQAVLALIVSFGLDLSAEQIGSILAVSAGLLAFVARSKVTPVE
jgi:hypothetical protein